VKLSSLWLYPLKGAAGIALSEWPLDSFGLMHDRRWMVVDATGGFITQRSDPVLGQVRPSIEGDVLVLRSAGGECRLPIGNGTGEKRRARVWQDEVDAIDCGAAAAAFITAHLGRPAGIVHMPDSTLRRANPAYARPGDRVSFVDALPLLIIGEGSLEELNRRLEEPIEMIRFRPNIVVSGTAPHAEDSWRSIRIGDIVCDVAKPCARCAVPTIDPATGIAGREPSRTLADYRRWNRKVWFGQNAIHRGTGSLRVGAGVAVLEWGEPEPPLL
jgi:uncharacterized protein YcbX